jgi:hypothetical protein
MVFQILQDSPWHDIFAISGIFAIVLMVTLSIACKRFSRLQLCILGVMFAVSIASIIGLAVGSHQRDAQNDANFSKQLMDEYGVTSSRSLYEIKLDFTRFDEARTIFTKDGKDTPVYIKLVHSDDKQYEMAFTVIDEKSLYPKLIK